MTAELRHAIRCRSDEGNLLKLIDAILAETFADVKDGRTLLAELLETGEKRVSCLFGYDCEPANNDVVLKLLELNPAAARIQTPSGSWPLHEAARKYYKDEVVVKLIDAYPAAVKEIVNGRTVLWELLESSGGNHWERWKDSTIAKVLALYPAAAGLKSPSGSWPSHVACRKGYKIGRAHV